MHQKNNFTASKVFVDHYFHPEKNTLVYIRFVKRLTTHNLKHILWWLLMFTQYSNFFFLKCVQGSYKIPEIKYPVFFQVLQEKFQTMHLFIMQFCFCASFSALTQVPIQNSKSTKKIIYIFWFFRIKIYYKTSTQNFIDCIPWLYYVFLKKFLKVPRHNIAVHDSFSWNKTWFLSMCG